MAQIFYSVVKYVNGKRAPTFGLYFFDETGKEVVNEDIRDWQPLIAATPERALALGGNTVRLTAGSAGSSGKYCFCPHVGMVVTSTFNPETQELSTKVENLNFPEAWAHKA